MAAYDYPKELSSRFNIQLRAMRLVLMGSFLLMAMKMVAYFFTHSTAILSDALESVINIAANTLALYSIYWSSLPKDENHPYGHGKVEFLSAGFEGALIFIAGAIILYKAVYHLIEPAVIEQLGLGISLTAVAGLGNLVMGGFLIHYGKKYNSIALAADGKHLLTDTYSSAGLVAGLLIIHFTGLAWLDSVLAILLGVIIIITGVRLIRKSLAGLMDEADAIVLKEITDILNRNRKPNWIDVHNLRLVKYGQNLHIDCHLTLPWYEDLKTSHDEIKKLEQIINDNMGNRVECFIHADPCRTSSCSICELKNCPVREHPFRQNIPWNLENLVKNKMHRL